MEGCADYICNHICNHICNRMEGCADYPASPHLVPRIVQPHTRDHTRLCLSPHLSTASVTASVARVRYGDFPNFLLGRELMDDLPADPTTRNGKRPKAWAATLAQHAQL